MARRPVWLGSSPFVSLPQSLLLHPQCRPTHTRVYAVLARLADYESGEVHPIGPHRLAAAAHVSFHSIRGYQKRSVPGVVPDLAGWGFLEELPAPRAAVHVRLLPAPDGAQLSFDMPTARSVKSRAQPARDRDPTIESRAPLPLITDSFSDSSDREPDDSSKPSKSVGQWAASRYVDLYSAKANRPPDPQLVSQMGFQAKKAGEQGRTREELEAGIQRVVGEARSPNTLPLLLMERDLGVSRNGSGYKGNGSSHQESNGRGIAKPAPSEAFEAIKDQKRLLG